MDVRSFEMTGECMSPLKVILLFLNASISLFYFFIGLSNDTPESFGIAALLAVVFMLNLVSAMSKDTEEENKEEAVMESVSPFNSFGKVVAVVGAVILTFCLLGYMNVYVKSFCASGYATQMEVDDTVYRLDDANGEIVTFILTKDGIPSMKKIGEIPQEGELTYTCSFKFVNRFSKIIFYHLDIFIPTGEYR